MLERLGVRIREMPSSDRPRERLLRLGTAGLADWELVAVILGTGVGGVSAAEAAAALVARFAGDLRRMGHAGMAELAEVPGIGLVGASRIRAALGLAGRLAERPLERGEPLGSPEAVFARFAPSLRLEETERFLAVPLDRKNRVLRVLTVAQGGVCSVEIIPRDVYAAIVREGAASVVFLHNHPSGDPAPSAEDHALTERLRRAGEVVGVPLRDHMIVGHEKYFSFFEKEFAAGIERS
ncbi:MAG TPA: DNA repair protein RadC [Haliangiales bacterium]|nr:DNA repair protein RadC [Haliangiales bacterium]